MKVFVSSLITGMEPIRAAARAAVQTLGHEPVMAEDFGALPHSPQIACLDGVRQSASVVLILGARYGAKQASGLSATHEEYREAREQRPVLAFIQEPMDPEPDQAAFLREVQGWTGGLIRAGFTDPTDLQTKVTRALHRLELANATAPFDSAGVLNRALASFPPNQRHSHYGGLLSVVVAGGPDQAILRPSEIERPALAEELEREALFGSARIFARGEATSANVVDGRLVMSQGGQRRRALILDAQGGILIDQPIEEGEDRHGMSVILVETLEDRLAVALRYVAWLLDRVDPTQRLSHIVVAAKIIGGFAMRTRREQTASPNSIQMSGFGHDDRPAVHLLPPHMPRAALVQNADHLVGDLTTLLRRQWK